MADFIDRLSEELGRAVSRPLPPAVAGAERNGRRRGPIKAVGALRGALASPLRRPPTAAGTLRKARLACAAVIVLGAIGFGLSSLIERPAPRVESSSAAREHGVLGSRRGVPAARPEPNRVEGAPVFGRAQRTSQSAAAAGSGGPAAGSTAAGAGRAGAGSAAASSGHGRSAGGGNLPPASTSESAASHLSGRRAARARAGALLAGLRLPSGARRLGGDRSGAALLGAPAGEPAGGHLLDEHRFYLLPGTPRQAIAFVEAHPPAGLRLESQGSSGRGIVAPPHAPGSRARRRRSPEGDSVTVSWTATFSAPHVHRPLTRVRLVVEVAAARGAGTALRADAEVQWSP